MTDYVEVREKSNGTWIVSYPDEGFIPCAPVCNLKHKHEYDAKLVESHYKPKDYKDAMSWAKKLAGGRKIQTVKQVKKNAKVNQQNKENTGKSTDKV